MASDPYLCHTHFSLYDLYATEYMGGIIGIEKDTHEDVCICTCKEIPSEKTDILVTDMISKFSQ